MKEKKFRLYFCPFLVIKTLDPGSLEILDPDSYPDRQHGRQVASTICWQKVDPVGGLESST
jgi:hypothetical protein